MTRAKQQARVEQHVQRELSALDCLALDHAEHNHRLRELERKLDIIERMLK